MKTLFIGTGSIIAIAISGAVILIGLFVLLQIFVFSRNKVKKSLKDIERKYSYLDALLIGQDSQYIHRLEIISRTNLLFVDKYNEYSKRFKDVLDGDDKFVESMIKQLRALIQNKQYKHINVVVNDTKKALATFEANVNSLDKELYAIIKPEEEARQQILKLKENYRRIKQVFFANANDLELVAASFNKVFQKFDNYFVEFETLIEGGEYEEANNLITNISKVVNSLDKTLVDMPSLCLLANSIVPNKIKELNEEYIAVEKQGVPLFNISFKRRVAIWNDKIASIKDRLINLRIAGINDELSAIQDEIISTRDALKKEIQDKDDFSASCDNVYRLVVELEKSFVKICSILPEIRKVYIVSEEQENNIKMLSTSIDELGNAKRTLDNFVHSATPQPFSILKEKLETLKKDYQVASNQVQDFKVYLDSLKRSSEDAYAMVFAYFYHCKEVEKNLREINIPKYTEQHFITINNCYDLLNNLDKTLKNQPIDVIAVNEMVEQLKAKANKCFEDVDEHYKEMKLAESAIVFGNRDRNHQSDVHQQYLTLESLFYDGDFQHVHESASQIYNRLHVEEN